MFKIFYILFPYINLKTSYQDSDKDPCKDPNFFHRIIGSSDHRIGLRFLIKIFPIISISSTFEPHENPTICRNSVQANF